MNLQTFTNEQEWVNAAKSVLLAEAVRIIGLSGGSTPGNVYEAFARVADAHYTFIQIDERMVPADHVDSNQCQAKEALAPMLDHATFIAVPTAKDPENAASEYEMLVKDHLPLDVAVLGIGPDGHTASLFPHSPALSSKRLVAHTITDQFAVRDRITLTFLAIMQSKKLLVLLKGKEKQAILDTLQSGTANVEDFPAIKLLEHPNLHVLFLSN